MQIWDTAGQERFRTITVSYFRGANGIMLVYDVTDRETFESVEGWIQQIKEHAEADVSLVLVANKCDKHTERVISYDEGLRLASRHKIDFIEVSAKSDLNVTEAFELLAQHTKRR